MTLTEFEALVIDYGNAAFARGEYNARDGFDYATFEYEKLSAECDRLRDAVLNAWKESRT